MNSLPLHAQGQRDYVHILGKKLKTLKACLKTAKSDEESQNDQEATKAVKEARKQSPHYLF